MLNVDEYNKMVDIQYEIRTSQKMEIRKGRILLI
jgi:hypothetical protein